MVIDGKISTSYTRNIFYFLKGLKCVDHSSSGPKFGPRGT